MTISVTDVDEPPAAPAAPTVTGASSSSVSVSWTAPDVTGKPAITDYDVQYKLSTETNWTDHTFTGTGTSTTISSLTASSTYNVQVKAKNAEGESAWSATGSGATSAASTPMSPNALVSNIGQNSNTQVSFTAHSIAQGFRTGSNTDGYTLSSVEVKFNGIPDSSLVVQLATGLPSSTTVVATLNNPSSLSAGNNTFTAPSNTTLDASTNYFVIVVGDSRHPSTTTIAQTLANAEDAGGQSGFSVQNNSHFRAATSSGSWSSSGSKALIRVNGTVNAGAGPTITIAAGTSPVTEGAAATFTVTADSAPDANLTVSLSVTEASGSDFVAAGNEGGKSVTIAANATSANFSVPTVADTTDEPNGSVTVTVASGTGYTVGSNSSASVAVNDDDAPADTAAPDFGTETVANQSYVIGTAITDLVLPEATGGDGALTYSLSPTPPAGLSFTASTRTLSGTPTAGQTATTYTYKVIDEDTNTADSDADTLTFTIAVTYGCSGSTAVGGSTVTSGGIVDDCEALLASEATLVGTGTALNWDTGTAMSSWDGVTLSSDRVSAAHPYDA